MLTGLSDQEVQTIGECLRAAAFGEFFPDWEFHTLFGLERDKAKRIATQWPHVDWSDKNVELMIINSMNNLLGYPHGKQHEWGQHLSVPQDVVKATLRKLRATHSAASGRA